MQKTVQEQITKCRQASGKKLRQEIRYSISESNNEGKRGICSLAFVNYTKAIDTVNCQKPDKLWHVGQGMGPNGSTVKSQTGSRQAKVFVNVHSKQVYNLLATELFDIVS